jgi:ABC-2 type transporter
VTAYDVSWALSASALPRWCSGCVQQPCRAVWDGVDDARVGSDQRGDDEVGAGGFEPPSSCSQTRRGGFPFAVTWLHCALWRGWEPFRGVSDAAARGADFHVRASGLAWFAAAAVLFVVLMYGIAQTLTARIHQQEEYIGATPAIAILPWFFAGALFPIGALPGALTAFAKLVPLTHAMALMRYGLVDPKGTGLHDIWGMSNTTTEAWLSLTVVLLFAAALTAVAIRAFTGSAVS